jgi:hypothetical protein
MFKYKIGLETMTDIQKFVSISTKLKGDIQLIDDNAYCVNGKSLLGAISTIEWDDLYCVSDRDIRKDIAEFIIEPASVQGAEEESDERKK